MNKRFLVVLATHFKRHKDFFIIGPMRASNGAVVPIYSEMRTLYSNPEAMKIVTAELSTLIKHLAHIDIVAGVETAGIPPAMAVSLKTGIPFVYIKKKRKAFLKKVAVEGVFSRGQRAVLIDDALGWGNTKKLMIRNARREGLIVTDIICLYDSYSHEHRRNQWFKKHRITLHHLVTREEIFAYFYQSGLISRQIVEINDYYTHNPATWHRNKMNWKKFLQWKRTYFKTGTI